MDYSNQNEKKKNRDPVLSSSSQPSPVDFVNITLNNPPIPQAASTVERKYERKTRPVETEIEKKSDINVQNNKPLQDYTSTNTSLGILDLQKITDMLEEDTGVVLKGKKNPLLTVDLSTERILARKLLEKCSQPISLPATKDNKNDMNRQNLLSELANTHAILSSSLLANSKEESTLTDNDNKFIGTSVFFEPNEIAARSSEYSRCSEKHSFDSSQMLGQISFNTAAAEIMAQFGDEEFQEMNSKITDHLNVDRSFVCQKTEPVASGSKNLDLDFSGIIGELNLTHESGTSSKISIGDYFKKKCGNIGHLSETDITYTDRPSFGLDIHNPEKKGKPRPLVDVSMSTEASEALENHIAKNTTKSTDFTSDISRMNLSSIARILKDHTDTASPRLIVDNLLNAKKHKLRSQAQMDRLVSNTYTVLPHNRNSLPTTASAIKIDVQTPEKDTTFNNSINKSLETPIMNDNDHLSSKMYDKSIEQIRAEGTMTQSSAFRNHHQREAENELFISHVHRKSTPGNSKYENTLSQPTLDSPRKLLPHSHHLSLSKYNMEDTIPVPLLSTTNSKIGKEMEDSVFEETPSNNLKRNSIRKDNLSPVNKENLEAMKHRSSSVPSTRDKKNVVIGKKSQEVTTCLVGVPTEAEIEMLNDGDRWILVSASLHQIQGDKDNIKLEIPKETILIKPTGSETIKIGVTITKLCKPIMAGMCLAIADMVTKENWDVVHMMCFIPEEPEIHISTPTDKEELYFEDVAENGYKSLPITIENKNNADITIDLHIVQSGPTVFFIDNSENETLKSSMSCDGTLNMILKPKESITTNIELRGTSLDTLKDTKYKMEQNLCYVGGKLVVSTSIADDIALVVKEIALSGKIGIEKIEPIEPQLPIVVQQKQSKPFGIRNTGSILVAIHASVVFEDNAVTNESMVDRSFSVMPESFTLGYGEKGYVIVTYECANPDEVQRHALFKITAGNSVYTYPIKGEKISSEQSSDNCLRCDTPQFPRRVTSPSSPHSATSNRSGHSGRESPGSSCGGSSVTDDVIPIRATHNALVWGSIRAGKRDTKEFTIRNMSCHKIKLIASIEATDKSFKFFREGHGTISNVAMILQGMESKTLTVVFEPNAPGAVAGKIMFHYYSQKRENVEGRPTKVIQLYGYGGFGKLEILEAFKDTNGQMWLSLGRLNSEGSLLAKIKLRNNGDLPCYAKVDIVPKAVYPTMQLNWEVSPKEFLLGPKENQWVTLEYRPKRKDLDSFKHTDVSHVGTLKITHGDEPTRLRIRRLYMKMKEMGQLNKKDDSFKIVVSPLCKAFPGEKFISDLTIIRDSVQHLSELCRGINEHEVRLTMERNNDDTESFMTDNMDETATFHSLYNDNGNDVTYTGQSFMPSETTMEECSDSNTFKNSIIAEPSSVTLMPPAVNEVTIILSSSFLHDQYFQCGISSMDYISVSPSTGKIPAGKSVPLRILLKKPCVQSFTSVLEIYTENHRCDVSIKVKNDKNETLLHRDSKKRYNFK